MSHLNLYLQGRSRWHNYHVLVYCLPCISLPLWGLGHLLRPWGSIFFAYSKCQKLWLWDTQLIIAGKGNPPRTNQVAMFLDQGLFEDTQSLFMSFLGKGMDKVTYLRSQQMIIWYIQYVICTPRGIQGSFAEATGIGTTTFYNSLKCIIAMPLATRIISESWNDAIHWFIRDWKHIIVGWENESFQITMFR